MHDTLSTEIPSGWSQPATDQASALRAPAADVRPDVTYQHRSGTRKLTPDEVSALVAAEVQIERLYRQSIIVQELTARLLMASPELHNLAFGSRSDSQRMRELVSFLYGVDSDNAGEALRIARQGRPQHVMPPTADAFATALAAIDETPAEGCTCGGYGGQSNCKHHGNLAVHGVA